MGGDLETLSKRLGEVKASGDNDEIAEALRNLEECSVTLAKLKSTGGCAFPVLMCVCVIVSARKKGVGKIVHSLRKHPVAEVSKLALSLKMKWTDLLQK